MQAVRQAGKQADRQVGRLEAIRDLDAIVFVIFREKLCRPATNCYCCLHLVLCSRGSSSNNRGDSNNNNNNNNNNSNNVNTAAARATTTAATTASDYIIAWLCQSGQKCQGYCSVLQEFFLLLLCSQAGI